MKQYHAVHFPDGETTKSIYTSFPPTLPEDETHEVMPLEVSLQDVQCLVRQLREERISGMNASSQGIPQKQNDATQSVLEAKVYAIECSMNDCYGLLALHKVSLLMYMYI